jgi:hypothetical protein
MWAARVLQRRGDQAIKPLTNSGSLRLRLSRGEAFRSPPNECHVKDIRADRDGQRRAGHLPKTFNCATNSL